MRKKRGYILGIFLVLFFFTACDKGKNLFPTFSKEDIESITITEYPSEKSVTISDSEQIEEFINLAKNLVLYNQDDSARETEGSLVDFSITLTDGTKHSIGPYGSFLYVNDICYKTDLDPSNALADFGRNLTKEQTDPIYTIEGKFLIGMANDYLILDEKTDTLYTLPTSSLTEDIKPGALLSISYQGPILETYPSIFSTITSVSITGQEESLFPVYYDVIDQIYKLDPGLNDKIQKLALDLTTTDFTQAEKNALVFYLQNQYGVDVFFSTYEELIENDYLKKINDVENAKRNLYQFEDGILLRVSKDESKSTKKKLVFSVSKWRSPLGAVGTTITAKKKDGVWEYTSDDVWIS